MFDVHLLSEVAAELLHLAAVADVARVHDRATALRWQADDLLEERARLVRLAPRSRFGGIVESTSRHRSQVTHCG